MFSLVAGTGGQQVGRQVLVVVVLDAGRGVLEERELERTTVESSNTAETSFLPGVRLATWSGIILFSKLI